jgi:hypothetical protein
MFMLSVTVNAQSKLFGKEDDVRVFMDGKTFYNSDTGLEIEYGAISSYNTYGIKAKNKEGVAAYFINVDITIYGNRANLVGMNPDNGGKLGFTVYKDKLIVGPGEPQEMIFYLK